MTQKVTESNSEPDYSFHPGFPDPHIQLTGDAKQSNDYRFKAHTAF